MVRFIRNILLYLTPLVAGDQLPLHSPEDNTYPTLNFSSSSPLIFHSTFSLLQQWSNTFFPNGHSVAPCTIAKHTNLYHARDNSSFPPSPEWFAFDPSMAYSILGQTQDSHLLTFRTTKQVKCLYFDGTSAALQDNGSMDSQMLVLHNSSANVPDNPIWGGPPRKPPNNETQPSMNDTHPPGHGRPPHGFNPLQAEYDRASGLCDFIHQKNLGGPGWGYEGIVRMNAAFELIWCNFTSPSAQLVSWLNVSAPLIAGIQDDWTVAEDPPQHPPGRGGRPGWGSALAYPFRGRSAYEWFLSATKAYGFVGGVPGQGESRVHIDSCGLFSFYDSALEGQKASRIQAEQTSLNLSSSGEWQSPQSEGNRRVALQKLMRRRRNQRADNVTKADGQYMRFELEQRMRLVLNSDQRACSGIDWVEMSRAIVSDYSADMRELNTLLDSLTLSTNGTAVRDWLASVRGLAHHLYMPFFEYPRVAKHELASALTPDASESVAALGRCESQHALLISGQQLSTGEDTTYTAIADVLSAICTTVLPVFLSVEAIWMSHFNNASAVPSTVPSSLAKIIESTTMRNRHALEELMAWLGWAEQWTSCSPGCEIGQVCAIPIWPVQGVGHFSGDNGGMGRRKPDDGDEGWLEARCVDAEHSW